MMLRIRINRKGLSCQINPLNTEIEKLTGMSFFSIKIGVVIFFMK
jgi:hypothetical protein